MIINSLLKNSIVFSIAFMLVTCNTHSDGKKSENISEDTAIKSSAGSSNKEKVILFFGNSITAGYNLDTDQAFPALISAKIDALGLPYRVVNAGLSGETTASGTSRIDWVLQNEIAIFVLELGANDGLRGIPLTATKKNLQRIIDRVKQRNSTIEIVVAGMQIPPNMGQDYTAAFKEIFPTIAQTNKATLIPFLLEGVAGIAELNLPDGIHPTAKGHEIIARTVWKYIEPLLTE